MADRKITIRTSMEVEERQTVSKDTGIHPQQIVDIVGQDRQHYVSIWAADMISIRDQINAMIEELGGRAATMNTRSAFA